MEDLRALRKLWIIPVLLCMNLLPGITLAEEDDNPPYNPNKIDFNRNNASNLVSDLEAFALNVAKKHIRKFRSFLEFLPLPIIRR